MEEKEDSVVSFTRVFLEERSSQQRQNSWGRGGGGKQTKELKNTSCDNNMEVISNLSDLLFSLQEKWVKRWSGR